MAMSETTATVKCQNLQGKNCDIVTECQTFCNCVHNRSYKSKSNHLGIHKGLYSDEHSFVQSQF